MTVDNFNAISELLNFNEPNSFYIIQILKRRKENPELTSNVRTVNIYEVYSKEDLLRLKDRIIEDCEHNNARAYINLNRLDAYLVALKTQAIITENLINGQYHAVRNAYATACGNLRNEDENEDDVVVEDKVKKYSVFNDDKIWVIDIDIIDAEGKEDATQIKMSYDIVETIHKLHRENNKKPHYRILAKLPTKNGHHIITHPFNRTKFDEQFKGVTYYSNSPTILYI